MLVATVQAPKIIQMEGCIWQRTKQNETIKITRYRIAWMKHSEESYQILADQNQKQVEVAF